MYPDNSVEEYQYDFRETFTIEGDDTKDVPMFEEELKQLCARYGFTLDGSKC